MSVEHCHMFHSFISTVKNHWVFISFISSAQRLHSFICEWIAKEKVTGDAAQREAAREDKINFFSHPQSGLISSMIRPMSLWGAEPTLLGGWYCPLLPSLNIGLCNKIWAAAFFHASCNFWIIFKGSSTWSTLP